jgi:hypothetical protein
MLVVTMDFLGPLKGIMVQKIMEEGEKKMKTGAPLVPFMTPKPQASRPRGFPLEDFVVPWSFPFQPSLSPFVDASLPKAI